MWSRLSKIIILTATLIFGMIGVHFVNAAFSTNIISNSVGGSNTVTNSFATSTTNIFIDSNRTDSYTADGSNIRPYKSIGAAIKTFSATYVIFPGTYVEGNLTFTATSTLLGNQATILSFSGMPFASPAGTLTFNTGFSAYDLNVISGNVVLTDTAVSDPGSFENSLINGNLTLNGLAIFEGGQLQGGSLYTAKGSLTNIAGVNILDTIGADGTINLNDDNLQPNAAGTYALVASSTYSSIAINGLSLENTTSNGGGIYCANGATSTPNEISNLGMQLGTTTASGAVNCGSATVSIGSYSAFNVPTGNRIYGTFNNLVPFSFAGLNTEGNTLLNVQTGLTGLGTSTPWANLSVAAGSLGTTPLFTVSTSTASATTTVFHIDKNGNIGFGTTTSTATTQFIFDGAVKITSKNGAVIIGDTTGNARGSTALDIQNTRTGVTQVASGGNSLAVGYANTASGFNSSAMGNNNTVSGADGSAFGYVNTASVGNFNTAMGALNIASGNSLASAVGYNNTASAANTTAVGWANTASAAGANVFGSNITNTIASSTQIGPSDAAKMVILISGNVGIGTTTPAFQFSVGSTSATSVGNFSIDSAGNIYYGGGKPSVACAATCTLDANAHDGSGIIFISGVQTSVTLTFYTTKPWAPHCTVTDNVTTGNYDGSSTPTQLVMGTAASIGTASITYNCSQ